MAEIIYSGGAAFSPCRQYRFRLWRGWQPLGSACAAKTCMFIMLNPSTADSMTDDPTIRKCMGFAQRWGYDRLEVVNLFALCSTDPKILTSHPNPVGEKNESHILTVAKRAECIVAAWGVRGGLRDRDRKVCELLSRFGFKLECLIVTKDGYPQHPLYIKYDTKLIPYEGRP